MKHWDRNSDVVLTFEDDGDWLLIGIGVEKGDETFVNLTHTTDGFHVATGFRLKGSCRFVDTKALAFAIAAHNAQ